MIALALSFLASVPQITPQDPVPKPLPELRLNEVLFDPQGVDGGTEWIEVFNAGTGAQVLSTVQLRSPSGGVLWQGGAGSLPPGGFFIVQLGPIVPEDVDSDPSDGYACIFTGQAPADVLANGSGGVVLRIGRTIIDAVFWGTSGPPAGTEYTQAVSAGQWPAGGFVNTGFSGGALQEGDSIGRSTDSADTQVPGDWATAGGKNAARPTPGDRNDMYVATELDLVRYTQTFVNQVLTYVGAAGGNDLSVLGASHASLVVDDPDMIGGFRIGADHSFTIEHQGIQKTLSGNLSTTYERAGAPFGASYTLGLTGQLSDGNGTTLVLNSSLQRSGFHTHTRLQTETSSWTWSESGITASMSVTRTYSEAQTSGTTWDVSDVRTGVDWRGPDPFTVQGSLVRTKLGDGAYQEQGSVVMPFPAFPPAPGSQQSNYGSLTWGFAWSFTENADRAMNKSITAWDLTVNDGSGNALYRSELVQDGTQSVARTAGVPFSVEGAWTMGLHTLERYGYPDIDAGSPTANRDLTLLQTNSLAAGGELVSQGSAEFAYGGSSLGTLSFFVDGPVQQGCGCGCGSDDCDCGGPKPKKKLSPENPIAVAATGVVCAVGAALAAPSVVGIGIVGGLCVFVGYLWW